MNDVNRDSTWHRQKHVSNISRRPLSGSLAGPFHGAVVRDSQQQDLRLEMGHEGLHRRRYRQ
jgi:hypothetical protein